MKNKLQKHFPMIRTKGEALEAIKNNKKLWGIFCSWKEEYQQELQADKAENENGKKLKKPSMSFGISFSLSLKNLFTKKGRTMLTSFAGSIGIIGIALVLSISQGFNTYINVIQEETLSSYPLTIQKTNTDLSVLMQTFMGSATSDSTHDKDAVYKKSAIWML